MANGTLFTEDFLREGIDLSPPWSALSETRTERFSPATSSFGTCARAAGDRDAIAPERDLIRAALAEVTRDAPTPG